MQVVSIATISVDGRITPPGKEGTEFSSPETGQNFIAEIMASGAVVSGRRTYDVVKEMMLGMMRQMDGMGINVIMTRNPDQHREEGLPANLEFTDLGPEELVAELDRRGIQRVLLAGGAEIYAAFAAAGLIDEWILVVEPILLGGGTPVLAFEAEQKLRLAEQRMLNEGSLLLRYEAVR